MVQRFLLHPAASAGGETLGRRRYERCQRQARHPAEFLPQGV